MQDDIEKAYNRYMSKKKAVWSQIAEVWGSLYLRVELHLFDIFRAGYKAHAAQSDWVPIADIPEAWKDGRCLVIQLDESKIPHYDYPQYFGCWREDKKAWMMYSGATGASDFVTHAMLPPPPPQSKGEPK